MDPMGIYQFVLDHGENPNLWNPHHDESLSEAVEYFIKKCFDELGLEKYKVMHWMTNFFRLNPKK